MKDKTLHSIHSFIGRNYKSVLFFFVGLAALIWFLIRVTPKPSRAAYPCQQAAFPFASAFVIWLSGILTSSFVFVKAKARWRRSKYIIAAVLFFLAMAIFMVTSTSIKHTQLYGRAWLFTGNILGNPLPEIKYFPESDSTIVEPAAEVAIVKSSKTSAEDIDFNEIKDMVTEAVEKAGGLDGIVSDGDTVIIKPNLVVSIDGTSSAQQLDPEVNGITTDYRVVQAMVNIVRGINPSGQIYILEGSADGSTAVNMIALNYDLITGIDSLISLEDVCGAYGDTSSVHLQGVSLPPDKALYIGANNRYWLHNLYYSADVVISMPVLKNHGYTGTTASIKNVGIGATPTTIYANPGSLLRWLIDHQSPLQTNLHHFIHDFFMCRPVDFVLADGLQSIQNGPISHTATQQLSDDQMNMRLILASNDPVAIDAISALLTGHDPQLTTHLVTLHNDTMGCCDARLIRVNGVKTGDEKKDFLCWGTGVLTKYDDFDPPWFTTDECYIVGDQLYLSLDTDTSVTKVDVMVDSIYLNQIVIGKFDEIYLDLDTLEINTGSQIIVYAYDQYLNFSEEELIATLSPELKISAHNNLSVSVAPNPCSETAFLRFKTEDQGFVISNLHAVSGRLIKRLMNKELPAGTHKIEVDVSDLQEGVYCIQVLAGKVSSVRRLVVVH